MTLKELDKCIADAERVVELLRAMRGLATDRHRQDDEEQTLAGLAPLVSARAAYIARSFESLESLPKRKPVSMAPSR